jgi:hypothetical protein
MRDRVVESIQEIKKLSVGSKGLFSSPDPEISEILTLKISWFMVKKLKFEF